MAERATRSHPVPLRVEKVQEALPAVVMVDYEDGKVGGGERVWRKRGDLERDWWERERGLGSDW